MNNADQPAMGQSVRTSQHHTHIFTGLTKRENACIQLRVPKSGDDELDVLIKEARRHEAAVRAMEGLLANPERYKYITKLVSEGMTQEFATAKNAYKALKMADALIKEL